MWNVQPKDLEFTTQLGISHVTILIQEDMWFCPGTPASSTHKNWPPRNNLKMALKHQKSKSKLFQERADFRKSQIGIFLLWYSHDMAEKNLLSLHQIKFHSSPCKERYKDGLSICSTKHPSKDLHKMFIICTVQGINNLIFAVEVSRSPS